jgi:hypothetical protein
VQWRGIRRTVMGTRSWTELFFLDEATALAAGQRPCFLCRRAAAVAFQAGFPTPDRAAGPKASDIDRVLHAERLDGRRKRLHDLTSPAALPGGAMIFQDGAPHLILNGQARRWSLRGYGASAAPLGLPESHICGTKCPAFDDAVKSGEAPGDGLRAGWFISA